MGHSQHKRPLRTAKEKKEDCIVLTNSSCTVSKRSVEKLYYGDEPSYFRDFVKKFQRRSPLINRGYYLRMRAIEQVVRNFLEEHLHEKTVVVNLGCGFDPLPFRLLGRHHTLCKNNTFLDIDYEQLITEKCRVIRESISLGPLLSNATAASQTGIFLKSNEYCAVACDLQNHAFLDEAVFKLVGGKQIPALFLAEVSITYMPVKLANSVIKWASTFPCGQFCLLEQYLPDGPDHPFAQTMLKHFEKLSSPLHSVKEYPRLHDQRMRFQQQGWPEVQVKSLWDMWSDDDFISVQERQWLDTVEPFDEWEEFALFSGHYFLLNAYMNAAAAPPVKHYPKPALAATTDCNPPQTTLLYSPNSKMEGCRRYGASFELANTVVAHGGQGTQSRLSDWDVYGRDDSTSYLEGPPKASMCHQITKFGEETYLMTGGRASPDAAASSCLLSRHRRWKRVSDMPIERYRHCAVAITPPGHSRVQVLIFGGRNASTILNDWLVWSQEVGWKSLKVLGDTPSPRFGAAITLSCRSTSKGILMGGIGEERTIMSDWYEWQIVDDATIRVLRQNSAKKMFCMQRFGAHLVTTHDEIWLIGGIGGHGVLRKDEEFAVLDRGTVQLSMHGTRPMLIGTCASTVSEGVLITGGGAVCFSFGTYWNTGSFLGVSNGIAENSWRIRHSSKRKVLKKSMTETQCEPVVSRSKTTWSIASIPATSVTNDDDVRIMVEAAQPKLLQHLDLGPCLTLWSPQYLRSHVGEEREVVVHVASTDQMDFLAKNFAYKTMTFGTFLTSIQEGQRVYLRSVSSQKPAEKSTSLEADFPTIASDFRLPQELRMINSKMHSSPFRISGPVKMWLHYDVMANVLCQIRGSKHLIMFPPHDVPHLGFPSGASSSQLDVFDTSDRTKARLFPTHPQEVVLRPGDVLFIPPLWAHAVEPLDAMTVSVNVFFRDLEQGYAAGKDVYGNRDLQAYESGRTGLQKINRAFDSLPRTVSAFYMKRLAQELEEMASRWE